MDEPTRKFGIVEQTWRPVVRLTVYYAALAAIYLVLVWLSPWMADHLSGVPKPTATGLDLKVEPNLDSPAEAALMAVITMASALLLTLPIIWVYTFARQKRGFQQSLAQTLVMLPIVVAIVVVLVKHSVALAFSLGGIVGAVAFRHRLEDTKDAVYVFVAIALGLAVGVQAYSVALAASAFFNVVALGLWVTDFARAPAPLSQEIAQKRVQLAKPKANNNAALAEPRIDRLSNLVQSPPAPMEAAHQPPFSLAHFTVPGHRIGSFEAGEE